MRTCVFAFVIASVSMVAGTAHAEPPWCKSLEGGVDPVYLKDAVADTDTKKAVYALVVMTCRPDADAKQAASQLAAARAKIGPKLGMVEDDWADAAMWADAQPSSRGNDYPLLYMSTQNKAASAYTPIEQYELLLNTTLEVVYQADLFPKLTETGRLGYVKNCIQHDHPIHWAICQADIDSLDRKAAFAEIRGDTTHSGYDRMIARLALDGLDARLTRHAADVKPLLAKDEAYGKMFAAAAAGRKTWASANPKLVELANAMDDARMSKSNKAYAGCVDKTWPALSAAIAAIPAKTYENMDRTARAPDPTIEQQAILKLINAPNGHLAALAHGVCLAGDKNNDPFLGYLVPALERWPGFRGPHTSAQTAILTAGLELDTKGESIDYELERHAWLHNTSSPDGEYGFGIVDSIKIKGDQAT